MMGWVSPLGRDYKVTGQMSEQDTSDTSDANLILSNLIIAHLIYLI